jgi:NADP-dependent 3-hydroxy acid dehydrogenase YdfG
LLGLAALATKILPDMMTAGAGDIVRTTSFVAYGEATIDELYYLAQEHANREVGAGQEAYNVKVGSMGTPLVGDDTRQSWPSTYKVRQSR